MYDSRTGDRATRLGESMMSKMASAIVAVTLAAGPLLLPVPAKAENGQIAAGVVGGLIGGAVVCGALASRPAPPPPVYYAPEPVYVEEPVCRLVRERYWDGYVWGGPPGRVGDWTCAYRALRDREGVSVRT